VNLLAAPFRLPPPLLAVPDDPHYGPARRLALWRLPVLAPRPRADGDGSKGERADGDGSEGAAGAFLAAAGGEELRRCVLMDPAAAAAARGARARYDLVICVARGSEAGTEAPEALEAGACEFVVGGEGGVAPQEALGGAEVEAALAAEAARVGLPPGARDAPLEPLARALLAAAALRCAPVLIDAGAGAGGAHCAAAEALVAAGTPVFELGDGEWGGRANCDLPRLPRDAVLAPPGVAGGNGSKGVAGEAGGNGSKGVAGEAGGNGPKVLCVIPARLRAVRFPGKLLADLAGQSVLQRTWTRARVAAACARVVVATDAEEIRAHVQVPPPLSYEVDTPRPSPRTNRTRRVPHPVLIGHASARPGLRRRGAHDAQLLALWDRARVRGARPSALMDPPHARDRFTRATVSRVKRKSWWQPSLGGLHIMFVCTGKWCNGRHVPGVVAARR